ncbi:MAG: branched-chain amino acid ABC transporter permease [SAR324 cluster bacterium]|nr:branched-chain amino acid ABC transporter permease [SAR324 cluster bacterium]
MISEKKSIYFFIIFLLLALFPWIIEESFYLEQLTRILILGVFAMSLDLLVGYTGIVSLGHAAFYGVGAYTLACVFQSADVINFWYALPLSLAASALSATIIGWLSIRTSGVYLLMITLAFGQMCYFFYLESPYCNGSDGILLLNKPEILWGAYNLLDLENETHFYFFVLGWFVAVFLLLKRILQAPFGQIIQGICANESRVRGLGYSTPTYKLVSFVIAGTLAGLAGFLEAAHTGFVTPAYSHWHQSGMLLVILILGGIRTLHGPVLGAAAIVLLEDLLPNITDHWKLLMGLLIIVIVLFLPNGTVSFFTRIPTQSAIQYKNKKHE